MSDSPTRRAGEAWSFRARVEREAALRFRRLAEAIRDLDGGSPVPALMERAAGDEDRHAILCAELAERYGEPAGGASIDVEIAPRGLAPREGVLYEVVAACCITETESVATVTVLLSAPAEPRVREVLHEIARDEVVHSRMGWAHLAREEARGVAFLGPWIPTMLAGTIEAELFVESEGEPAAEELLRHGVLPRARKREIFVGALEQVVFPGLEQFGVDTAPARAWLESMQTRRSPC